MLVIRLGVSPLSWSVAVVLDLSHYVKASRYHFDPRALLLMAVTDEL